MMISLPQFDLNLFYIPIENSCNVQYYEHPRCLCTLQALPSDVSRGDCFN